MSVFTKVITGLSKAESFLLTVFTKTNEVTAEVSKLAPPTIAAMLAVFYDVMKAGAAVGGVAAEAKSGDVVGAISLSQTTLALLGQVATDGAVAGSVVASDLKALGIAPATADAPQAPAAVAGAVCGGLA